MMKLAFGVLTLVVVLTAAACSPGAGSATRAPSPRATGAAGSAASAAVPTLSAPAATSSSTAFAEHGAPELEAMLPGHIEYLATTKASFSGLPGIPGTTTFPPTHDGLATLLDLVQKMPRDLRFAMATTAVSTPGPSVSVLDVAGVEAGQLAWMSGVSHAALTTVTVAGKQVQVQPGLQDRYVIYEKGELLFLLQNVPVKDQAAVLAALP